MLALLTEATVTAVVGVYVVVIGVVCKVAHHISDKAIHRKADEIAMREQCGMFQQHIAAEVKRVERDLAGDMAKSETRTHDRIGEMKADILREIGDLKKIILNGRQPPKP